MSDVLADDHEATPIRPAAAEGFYCDLCPAERGPFKSKGGLSGHRFAVHGAGAAAKKPPAAKKESAGKESGPSKTQAKPLSTRLEGSFGLIGIGVSFVEPYDGLCITSGAHELGASLGALADAYPQTRKYLEMLCLDSPAIAVVVATLPVLLPIMKHHGLIDLRLPGPYAGPPDPHPKKPGATPAEPPSSEPAAGAPFDIVSLLAGLGVNQETAAAPRPMGEGAPAPAEQPAAPEPAATEEPPPFFEGSEPA
jgi:hypothetical protein